MDGISDLIRSSQRASSSFCQVRIKARSQHFVTQKAFTRTPPGWHPDLSLPTSRTVGNQLPLFVRHLQLVELRH